MNDTSDDVCTTQENNSAYFLKIQNALKRQKVLD